jgi:hypothetical protein
LSLVTIIRDETTQGVEPKHLITVIKATGSCLVLKSFKISIQSNIPFKNNTKNKVFLTAAASIVA